MKPTTSLTDTSVHVSLQSDHRN